jgi:hypothetical protein
MELIGDLGKATQKGVTVNEAKVELWTFQHSLDGSRFGPRVVRVPGRIPACTYKVRQVKDLDLLNTMRELINKGRVYRQPEGTIATGWAELLVLLFDNYRKWMRFLFSSVLMDHIVVLAKPDKYKSSRREDRQVRYIINRRVRELSLGNLS